MAEEKGKKKEMIYYPFNRQFFKDKPKYDGLPYANMGIMRSVRWRKGRPVTKIGRWAGTFKPDGSKDKTQVNIAIQKRRQKTTRRNVCYS